MKDWLDINTKVGATLFLVAFVILFSGAIVSLVGVIDALKPKSQPQEPQEIEYAYPFRSVCWNGYVFVEFKSGYSKKGIIQLLENGLNGLQAVQCQHKEAK